MTTAGWLFMICSIGSVFALAGWCYWKVLTDPEPDDEAAPPESPRT